MNYVETIKIVVEIITLLSLLSGGLFALYQWKCSVKLKRSEFMNQIIEKLRFDKSLTKTMYKIDYEFGWYNDQYHNGNNDLEHEIDKLFSYFSYICYLRKTKNITNKEFDFLKYEIHRTCYSPDAQCYLWNIYHFSQKNKVSSSFCELIQYGIDEELFDESFTNKKSSKYKKFLNF